MTVVESDSSKAPHIIDLTDQESPQNNKLQKPFNIDELIANLPVQDEHGIYLKKVEVKNPEHHWQDDAPAAEIAEQLIMQLEMGKPLEQMYIFELANRAIQAERILGVPIKF